MKKLEMKDVQLISLNILKTIAKICEEQGFRYTLGFGTLIGAIRHKGFIPWDDDIDILMPRSDYEKFIKFMTEHPIENIKVFNWKYVNKYPLGISRVCDMRYKIEEKNFMKCDMGIFVDIYPLDGLANTYEEAKKAFYYTDKARANLLRLIKPKNENQNFFSIRYNISGIILKIKGLKRIHKELEKKARRYSFEECKYVGVPNWNWAQIVFQRDWFNNLIKAQFEDGEFNIISNYDDMLREEYGDYMTLPPVEKRTYHHQYIAYKR